MGEEQESLQGELERQTNMAQLTRAAQQVDRAADMEPTIVTEATAEVAKERHIREELEKELKMEMAMKLLEKDVHEKQDTMVTLRAQLEDIKAINLELVTKLAECEKSLTYKTNLIQRLEMKSVAMADTLQQLDAKFVESERSCVQMRTTNAALLDKVMEAEEKVKDVEADLKIEREWRERLQQLRLRKSATSGRS